MGLQLFLLPAVTAENAGSPAPASGCDSSKNHDRWYLSDLECSPQSTQISLLANISRENVKHGQASLLGNIALENVERFQLAGTFNYARHVRGAQIAYNINIAKTVHGFQLGGVNIADSIKGTQIGALNISRHLNGNGIGFLTLAKNGLLHLDVSAEETGMSKLRFASGRNFFTSYSYGYTFDSRNHPFSLGMGFGYHKDFGKAFLEGELGYNLILDEHTDLDQLDDEEESLGNSDFRHNSLFQAGIRAGMEVWGNFHIFGGLTYNSLITHGNEKLMASWNDDLTAESEGDYRWPGLEIGIRFGR